MKYEYYNTFYLSDEFAEVLSNIISSMEGKKYICKTIMLDVPERQGWVFISPLDGYNPWGGGLKALSGAEINYINETQGRYEIGTLPAEEYPFFIIIDEEALDTLEGIEFTSKDNIYKNLEKSSAYFARYRDISFDSRGVVARFPYLKDFFETLDEWRSKTGRVTVDRDILDNASKKVLVP